MLTTEQKEFMKTFPHKPRMCVWELTLRCNLRCGHCGSRAGLPREHEMSTEECLGVVEDLAGLGCEVITLSGGEPTLHPGWPEIARAVRAHGMIPNMVTNGIQCDEAQSRTMKQVGLSNVAVSLDGTRDVHEAVRGKGTFERTVQAIANLRSVKMPVTVMTTINRMNLQELEAIYDVCVSLGVDRWRLQLGKPMGNLEDREDWVIEPRELLYLLPRLHRLAERGPVRVGIGDSIGFHSVYDIPLRATSWKGTPQRWAGCQAGLLGIGIESDGGVKGCLSMQAGCDGPDTFREGSIRERSLFEIWTDPTLFAYNRHFSPADLTGACATCAHARSCRGGAHCVSIAVNGTTTENPYCYYMLAEKARKSPLGRMKYQVAAAAALMFAGAGVSCFPPVIEADYGMDPCANVDCGDPELSKEKFDQCCNNMDYGDEPTCEDYACSDPNMPGWLYEECCNNMDYGDEPVCEDVDCADPELDPEVFDQCCINMDYGEDPCADVCCECDYGFIPEDIWELCCTDPPPEK